MNLMLQRVMSNYYHQQGTGVEPKTVGEDSEMTGPSIDVEPPSEAEAEQAFLRSVVNFDAEDNEDETPAGESAAFVCYILVRRL